MVERSRNGWDKCRGEIGWGMGPSYDGECALQSKERAGCPSQG